MRNLNTTTILKTILIAVSGLILASCNEKSEQPSEPAATVTEAVSSAPATAEASSAPSIEIRAVNSWTAEELANAKPFNTPMTTTTVAEMRALGAQAAPMSTEVISQEGAEGDGSLEGAHNLFSPSSIPIAPPGLEVEAVGSQGLYYSSSRLIPQSARMTYPYRTTGKMFFKDPSGGNWVCTAAVIAKRLVATAGHCVHTGSNGDAGYHNTIVFVPAYEGGSTNQAPYGTWAATWVKTTQAWATSGGSVPNRGDFAIFEVADQEFDGVMKSIGSRVGWLGYKTNSILPNHIKMIGYPGALDSGQIMHQVDTGNGSSAASSTVFYGSDLTQGASGGPWIQNFGKKAVGQPSAGQDEMNRLVGITSYVFTATEPKVTASSILDSTFVDLLREGCARAEGNCN